MRNVAKLIFVVFFVVIISASWVIQVSPYTYEEQEPIPLSGWMYRFGDSPFDDKGIPAWSRQPESESEGWQPIEQPFNPKDRGNQNTVWFKAKVPEGSWRDPSLMLSMHERFDIYTAKGLFYRYGTGDFSDASYYPAASLRLAAIPADALGGTIYFRVHSDSSLNIGMPGEGLVGAKSDFMLILFRQDLDDLLFGFLYAVLGCTFLYSYSLFRTQKMFFSFAVFALFFGVHIIGKTMTVHLFYDNPFMWMVVEVGSLVLGIVGLIRFTEQYFGAGPKRYVRRVWQLHLLYAGAAGILVPLGAVSYSSVANVYHYIILTTIALILPKVIYEVRKGEHDGFLFLLGSLALCTAGVIDIADNLLNGRSTLAFVTTYGLAVLIATIFVQLLRRVMELMMIARNSEKLSMVSQLAAGVAHEIRNPLSVISGFVQLLKQDPSHYKYLELVSSEIDRMNGIVGDFLLFSKPSKEALSRWHVADILKETLELFRADMEKKRIMLDFRADSDLPPLLCDANQLKQVFINIIKNGIESMSGGGKLFVLVEGEGRKKIRVRVIDQGVGIPQEVLRNIGQPFYTTKEHGTGLGLMISVKYLEHHGGTMQIRSKVNEGTTVDILLPTNTQSFMDKELGYPI